MGGAVSNGKNNDELVDILIDAEYLKTPFLQRVFRAVDRGDYYISSQKDKAYRDAAWRSGNLHLSAPCVYSEVMEALKLKTGHSFLNLGSGSGYLSTMAGLILGPYGVNHGIEYYKDVVNFANMRLEEFVNQSEAIDAFEFCVPNFMIGNCLHIDSSSQLYDRVYCGASCPEEHETYMKHLIKIGGILVMPLNNKLLQIRRTGDTTWESTKVLSVSFAPLLHPVDEVVSFVKMPDFTPPSLQEVCRSQIRTILRKSIDTEHPKLWESKNISRNRLVGEVRRIIIPFIDPAESGSSSNSDSSNSDSEDHVMVTSASGQMSIDANIHMRTSSLLRDLMRRGAEVLESASAGPSTSSGAANASSETKTTNAGEKAEDTSRKRKLSGNDDKTPNKNRKQIYTNRRVRIQNRTATFMWRSISVGNESAMQESEEEKESSEQNEPKSLEDNYKDFMLKKIMLLPLPLPLLRYLNYKRDNI